MMYLFILKPKSSTGEYLLTTDIPNVPYNISFHSQVNRKNYTCPARLISDNLTSIETFVETLKQQYGNDIVANRFIGSDMIARNVSESDMHSLKTLSTDSDEFFILSDIFTSVRAITTERYLFIIQCKCPDMEFKVFQEEYV